MLRWVWHTEVTSEIGETKSEDMTRNLQSAAELSSGHTKESFLLLTVSCATLKKYENTMYMGIFYKHSYFFAVLLRFLGDLK